MSPTSYACCAPLRCGRQDDDALAIAYTIHQTPASSASSTAINRCSAPSRLTVPTVQQPNATARFCLIHQPNPITITNAATYTMALQSAGPGCTIWQCTLVVDDAAAPPRPCCVLTLTAAHGSASESAFSSRWACTWFQCHRIKCSAATSRPSNCYVLPAILVRVRYSAFNETTPCVAAAGVALSSDSTQVRLIVLALDLL